MSRPGSRLPSHSTVAAYLALFVALATGGAYAAKLIGPKDIAKNAVKSKHIGKGQVKRADLAANAVTSPTVANGSLRGEDFAAGQIPAGPPGPPGMDGSADTAQQILDKLKTIDTDTSGLNADTLDGRNAEDLANGRIYAVTSTNGAAIGSLPLVPGLAYSVYCTAPANDTSGAGEAAHISFFTGNNSGTANAMMVGSGIETPTNGTNSFNLTNGAQAAGFPHPSFFSVSLGNSTGDALGETQLVIDAGGRTYSVALHMYIRASDGYCEVTGTAALAQ